MCFEVHTNHFLTILMLAGQFDPLFFLQGNCTDPNLIYVLDICCYFGVLLAWKGKSELFLNISNAKKNVLRLGW